MLFHRHVRLVSMFLLFGAIIRCSDSLMLKNISTVNILIDSLKALHSGKTMVPFAKVICISAVNILQTQQMMEDLKNGMARMHQEDLYQYVDLSVKQISALIKQKFNLMLFDSLEAMR